MASGRGSQRHGTLGEGSLLHKEGFWIALEVDGLRIVCEVVGKCDLSSVLFDELCQVEGTTTKCCRVAEDAKVVWRGWGVSGAGTEGDG